MIPARRLNGKKVSTFSISIFRVLCVFAAMLYLFFGLGFRLRDTGVLDPLSMPNRLILAGGYLLVFIGSFFIPFVKRYIGDFLMVMVLGSFAQVAYAITGLSDQLGTVVTLLMIIPLFNALLYHYRHLLFTNLAFIIILSFSMLTGKSDYAIWFIVVAVSITTVSYLMALARLAAAQRYEILFAESPMGIALHQVVCDNQRNPVDYRYLEVNKAFEQIMGHTSDELIGHTINELFPTSNKSNIVALGKVALTGAGLEYDLYNPDLDKYLEIKAYQPRPMQFVTIIKDITRRRKAEENLKHSMTHDWLTGLYSRRFFEEELARLAQEGHFPLSLIIADVNGLKIVNDTLGHQTGDILLKKTAAVLMQASRDGDIVARWGGDEFAMLLPDTTVEQATRVSDRIQEIIDHLNGYALNLSISYGYSTATDGSQDISETIKRAEDHMYRRKKLHTQSSRKSLVESLQNVLQNKSQDMVQRQDNVQTLTEAFGKLLGMQDQDLHELMLLAAIHDIGNVAICETVRDKPGPLSQDEWEAMKRHPEIGYRIALASLDMVTVAEGILYHHEWWDGSGYPKGLKGMAIPLQSRIIAITDSFAAMISNRSHAQALSIPQAMMEIRQGAGKHFDPGLVEIFLGLLADETQVARLRV